MTVCDGDFAVMAVEGAKVNLTRGAKKVRAIKQAACVRRVEMLDNREMREIEIQAQHFSCFLTGAQAKLPIILSEDSPEAKAGLPLGGSPSTHIVKPEPERFPGLAANEAYCMELARRIGLQVAGSRWQMIGKTPCLVVKRYDRTILNSGAVARIHQEDFCQALGYPPERKYQQEGGPSLRDCFSLLREWSSAPVLDIPNFLDGVTFGVLIGNADAHAKKFSILYGVNGRRLAPLYDQVCTLALLPVTIIAGDFFMIIRGDEG